MCKVISMFIQYLLDCCCDWIKYTHTLLCYGVKSLHSLTFWYCWLQSYMQFSDSTLSILLYRSPRCSSSKVHEVVHNEVNLKIQNLSNLMKSIKLFYLVSEKKKGFSLQNEFLVTFYNFLKCYSLIHWDSVGKLVEWYRTWLSKLLLVSVSYLNQGYFMSKSSFGHFSV